MKIVRKIVILGIFRRKKYEKNHYKNPKYPLKGKTVLFIIFWPESFVSHHFPPRPDIIWNVNLQKNKSKLAIIKEFWFSNFKDCWHAETVGETSLRLPGALNRQKYDFFVSLVLCVIFCDKFRISNLP